MDAAFEAFKEDGTQLIDTNLMCYGLTKSAYLTFYAYWPRYTLKSIQLDPDNGANYNQGTPIEPIYGITLPNWRSPIAFLVGDGSPCGEAIVNGAKTLLFVGASASTKCYVFDLMYDAPLVAGFKCWREIDGELTFNSGQPPLNILTAIQPPGNGSGPGGDFYYTAYAGGYNSIGGIVMKSYVDVPIAAGEHAAFINFTRSAGCNGSASGMGGFEYDSQEGAFGYSGGVRFMFTIAAGARQMIVGSYPYNYWRQIPALKPTALVISTSKYPFPFN